MILRDRLDAVGGSRRITLGGSNIWDFGVEVGISVTLHARHKALLYYNLKGTLHDTQC